MASQQAVSSASSFFEKVDQTIYVDWFSSDLPFVKSFLQVAGLSMDGLFWSPLKPAVS